ncbi:MAG: DNA repair protein RecO [Rickettsiaceae bacterium]|nr:MAG: DNA repair protein RecO [Rickettsiaceae bacterium]
MNFQDIGIIIGKRLLKENLNIVTLFTKSHGLYSGVVRKSAKTAAATYSEGNLVDFFWQARLHDHLGSAKCEHLKSYNSSFIFNKTKLYAFNSIVSLIKIAFFEREPHNNFFPVFEYYLAKSSISSSFDLPSYIEVELAILQESGYGLQLKNCAVSGFSENLQYVSPKSGKAVSQEQGRKYADKLLLLPKFLVESKADTSAEEVKQAFNLTSYFFNRYIFKNGQEPLERKIFTEHILHL